MCVHLVLNLTSNLLQSTCVSESVRMRASGSESEVQFTATDVYLSTMYPTRRACVHLVLNLTCNLALNLRACNVQSGSRSDV